MSENNRRTLYDYKRPAIEIDKLDEWMAFITHGNGKGKIAAIIAGFKILIVLAYLVARAKLIKTYMGNLNQEERRDNQEDNRDEVNPTF